MRSLRTGVDRRIFLCGLELIDVLAWKHLKDLKNIWENCTGLVNGPRLHSESVTWFTCKDLVSVDYIRVPNGN